MGGPLSEPSDDPRPLVLPPLAPCQADAPVPARVRVATWNISAARLGGLDAIEAGLRQLDADVVLLQEVDVGVRRTGGVDQPRRLGEALGMQHAFAASVPFDGGDFGMAVLTRLPLSRALRVSLESDGGYEDRIALDVTACAGPIGLRVVDVHADFVASTNERNLVELAEHVGPVAPWPTVIGGDFNAPPDAPGVRALLEHTGAVDLFAGRDPSPTRAGERIDYLLASPSLDAAVVSVGHGGTSEVSDHAPLWVDLALR